MESLRILQQVYSSSLEDDTSINYNPIPKLKINLRRHQHAVIDNMITHENSFISGKHVENSIIYSKYGILGDSVGVGKTFMVLGHIARLNNQRKANDFTYFNNQSSKTFYSLEKHIVNDISNVGCLVIVPHTLFRQWSDEITNKTNLKVLLLKTRKHVSSDNFMKQVSEAEVTLVSNTLFKDLFVRSNELNLFWERIYIDEADTIEITSSLIRGLLPTNFIWLITASFINLLFNSYNLYIGVNTYTIFKTRNNISDDLDNYLLRNLNQAYQSYFIKLYLRSTRFLNDIINSNHPMRGYGVIRCSKNFIDQSISLPQLYTQIIKCKPSLSHRIVYDVISSNVRQLLNAGDIKSALEQLGVKTESNSSLIEAVNENKQKELERLEKTYEFKQSLEYSSPQIKENALKNLKDKIDHLKEQISNLKQRIENYKQDVCPICYDEPSEAVITSCCSRIFCGMCILQSLARNPTCPLCRRDMTPSSLKKISEENIVVENIKEEVDPNEPKKKIDTLFEIIEKNPKGKFLVFSRYDNSFLEILETSKSKNLVAKELKGSKDMIASMLTNFKDGKVNMLLMNTIQMGAGLNITEATHVILLHSMTHEEEKQILGRAYRVGRDKELHFIKLLFPDEIN